jgi:3-dehydroquinate dehydratase II
MATILVIHGPNLNLLAQRETELYGSESLTLINDRLEENAQKQGHELQTFQSNSESELIDRIHSAKHINSVDYIIINPAAFTHTSIALRDALLAVDIPFIEVHISNVYKREPFRHISYFSDIALGVISGLGSYGYDLAFQSIVQIIHHYSQERN